MIRNISNTSGESQNCYSSSSGRVSGLIPLSSPMAVVFAVIAIVVLSVYCHFRGPFPHIVNESLEAASPSGTHFNSPSTVSEPILIFWVFAPSDYTCPSLINKVPIFDGCKSVRSVILDCRFGCLFSHVATARSGVPRFYSVVSNFDLSSALALTEGKTPPFSTGCGANDFELPKNRSNGDYFCRHSVVYSNTLFSDGEPALTGLHREFYTLPMTSQSLLVVANPCRFLAGSARTPLTSQRKSTT